MGKQYAGQYYHALLDFNLPQMGCGQQKYKKHHDALLSKASDEQHSVCKPWAYHTKEEFDA